MCVTFESLMFAKFYLMEEPFRGVPHSVDRFLALPAEISQITLAYDKHSRVVFAILYFSLKLTRGPYALECLYQPSLSRLL